MRSMLFCNLLAVEVLVIPLVGQTLVAEEIPTKIPSGMINYLSNKKDSNGKYKYADVPATGISINMRTGDVTYTSALDNKVHELFLDNIHHIQNKFEWIMPEVDFIGERRVYRLKVEHDSERMLRAREFLHLHRDWIALCSHPTVKGKVFNVRKEAETSKEFVVRNVYVYGDYLANSLKGTSSYLAIDFRFDKTGKYSSLEVAKDTGTVRPFAAMNIVIPIIRQQFSNDTKVKEFLEDFNLDKADAQDLLHAYLRFQDASRK